MSGVGEGDADEPVVVSKYIQTRQRWLKGKIVKSGHGRHYKKTFTMPKKRDRQTGEEHKRKIELKESKKQGKEKRIREKPENKRKLIWWACTSRSIFLSLPQNLTLFQKRKRDSVWALTIQVQFLQSH